MSQQHLATAGSSHHSRTNCQSSRLLALAELAREVLEARAKLRQLTTHLIERRLELRDPISSRLGRGDFDLRFRRRFTRWTGEEMPVSDLLLSGPSSHLHRELASDQVSHDRLDVCQSRELGEAIRARFDLTQRLWPPQHQDR